MQFGDNLYVWNGRNDNDCRLGIWLNEPENRGYQSSQNDPSRAYNRYLDSRSFCHDISSGWRRQYHEIISARSFCVVCSEIRNYVMLVSS